MRIEHTVSCLRPSECGTHSTADLARRITVKFKSKKMVLARAKSIFISWTRNEIEKPPNVQEVLYKENFAFHAAKTIVSEVRLRALLC